jgi:hypothetical protein
MFFFYVAGGTTHVSHKQEAYSKNHGYKITRKRMFLKKHHDGVSATV